MIMSSLSRGRRWVLSRCGCAEGLGVLGLGCAGLGPEQVRLG